MFPILRSPQNPLDTFLWIFISCHYHFCCHKTLVLQIMNFISYRNIEIVFSFLLLRLLVRFIPNVLHPLMICCCLSFMSLLHLATEQKTFMVITAFYNLFEVKDFSVFMFTSYNRSFVNIVIIFKDIWRHFLMVTY